MADRVFFATSDWPASPTVSSGFNGFPFALGPYDGVGESILEAYQLALTRAEVVWMYWRVKKWRVHGSVSYEVAPDPPTVHSFDWEAMMGDDNNQADPADRPSQLTRERELCLGPHIDSDDDLAAGGVIALDMFQAITIETPYGAGSSVRPYIEARILSGAVGVASSTIKDAPDFVAADIVGAIIVNGTSHPLTFYIDSAITGIFSGTFTIEPAEFWPYATSDGLPVYNTTTGAQLNDPLS